MGIEPYFQSATGEIQRATADMKRGLLAAMGFEEAEGRDAEAALEDLEHSQWRQTLPPVAVVRKSRLPLAVPVRLPVETGPLRWAIQEEEGINHEGSASFPDLELLRSAEHGGRAYECRRLVIDVPLRLGYHCLRIEDAGADTAEMRLIITPDRCYLPAGLSGDRRRWGISAQLYLLRSERNWGIGDFSDLQRLIAIAAELGASVIGLNPLHAMFPDDPERASPYSPASRLFLNILYIDVTAVPELDCSHKVRSLVETPEFRRDLAAVRRASRVDYAGVARLKLPVLELLFATFQAQAEPERHEAFAAFRREQGAALERFCLFQALREHFALRSPEQADWRCWPAQYHEPDATAVTRFARAHAPRIDFLAWTQWVADCQLAEAARTARAAGMSIGLYRDLAVGADSAGAEIWSAPNVVIASAHVGAPPDILNPAGQDWHLPPFNPHALRRQGYAEFVDLIRSSMRHAGGLRIDHVMGLQHLYWIPTGQSPAQGAYVSYPLDDLLGILALESQRQRCIVVGEDLGTVPEGFRERMSAAGVLSYRVVLFECREDGSFLGPEEYPALALATIGSHDLATLRGWWEERDIDLKEEKALYPSAGEARKQRERRSQERTQLLRALRNAGLALSEGFNGNSRYDAPLAAAVHEFLAGTRSGIAVAQLDELTDERDQVNLPATTDQYPNWRRKQSLPLELMAADPRVQTLAGILSKARPAERSQ
ncbi:MAG: 4-alpha-glucanotransferase [Nitrococcus sp.]|nr:4-alpha-glucanotransferase [Nitrococcus sp.]